VRQSAVSVCAIALAATGSLANIETFVVQRANVNINSVGGNRWIVTIQHDGTPGDCLVGLRSTNPANIIQEIVVLDQTSLPGETVLLNISDDGFPDNAAAIGSIESIEVFNPSGTRLDISTLSINGDLGATIPGAPNLIQTSQLRQARIGGNVYADVEVKDQTATPLAQNINLFTVGGDWLDGGLYNASGNIELVDVTGDILGDPADPIEFWSSIKVRTVIASSISEAQIGNSVRTGFAGTTNVERIRTTVGDLTSSTAMPMNILEFLEIERDLNASLVLTTTAIPAGNEWTIGRSLTSGASITLPSAGLGGTIIINDNEVGGRWSNGASVKVGPETLAVPDYTQPASLLGGGAVIVRSEFLPGASMPASGSVVPPTLGGTAYTIELAFSGNVCRTPTTGTTRPRPSPSAATSSVRPSASSRSRPSTRRATRSRRTTPTATTASTRSSSRSTSPSFSTGTSTV
jgi:hypothetical protein